MYDYCSLLKSLGVNDRPVVFVLDTFEEVQYQSTAHVSAIWEMLEGLQSALPRLRVVFVGRGTIEGRLTNSMLIEGLDQESAVAYLQARGVGDVQLATRVASAVGGSPMNLQLAAEMIAREGLKGDADLGITTREFLFFRLDDSQIQVQLYKRVLGHIHDPRVRRLAHPGLVLRRITPPLIHEVLAEPCGLNITALSEAEELFRELKREVSLVTEESDGALVHRPDLRKLMLAALEADEPQKTRAIREAVVRFYELRSGTVQDRAEEIYHRLLLAQPLDVVDTRWIEGVEAFLLSALGELTGARRAYLASRLGIEVDDETRRQARLEEWESIAERQAQELIAHGRYTEALDLLRSRTDRTQTSALFAIEARVLGLLGRGAESLSVLDRGIQRAIEARERRLTIALMFQAADAVLLLREPAFAPWLYSRIQSLADLSLQAADRIGLLGRQIALAKLGLPFRSGLEGDLKGPLREAFDTMADQILTNRPDVCWWAGSAFTAEDAGRIVRIVRLVGLPRTNAERELRTLATKIATFDAALSRQRRTPPGIVARELGVSIGESLTASWSEFLLTAPDAAVWDALIGLLEKSAAQLPEEVVSCLNDLMLAGLGIRASVRERAPIQPGQNGTTTARVNVRTGPGLDQPIVVILEENAPLKVLSEHGAWLQVEVSGRSGFVDGRFVTRSEPRGTEMVRLDGPILSELVRALTDAFTIGDFERLLSLRLGRSLDALTAPGPTFERVFQLVQAAHMEGWVAKLVKAARDSRPGNAKLASVASKLGLSPATSGLESIVFERASSLDPGLWREKIGMLEPRMCRVEVKGQAHGTGFLVGPDLVLTAYVVLEAILERELSHTSVNLRFDYKTSGPGQVSRGSVFDLADEWLVSYSPHGESPWQLGYVLLRARQSPGDQPIGSDVVESSAAVRGWIRIETSPKPPEREAGLVLMSHQEGRPLSLTFGSPGIVKVEGPRIYYRLDTGPGDSGAPCFTVDLDLIAFHIGRMQDSTGTSFGTLISAVVEDLDRQGFRSLISDNVE